jgi:hypothetical protein|tara:strand:+ start:7339 stop:7440 length:102 start_codon:yes stop_codon:yes gene_type:complete
MNLMNGLITRYKKEIEFKEIQRKGMNITSNNKE